MGAGASAGITASLSAASPAEVQLAVDGLPEPQKRMLADAVTTDRRLMTARIDFTQRADKSFDGLADDCARKRDDIVKSLRGNYLTKEERQTMSTMITLLQEQVYTAKTGADGWANEYKFYAGPDGVKAVCGGCELKIGSYFPPRQMLVVTPLTRTCRSVIFEAWNKDKIVMFSGPAGTGKTETIKDTCLDLGMNPIVFNCSDQTTIDDIKKTLSSFPGSPVIFDEFNRMKLEVVQSFPTIAKGQRIGITWNPGYAGGTELPDELKSMAVSQDMLVPDHKIIAEIMLFAEGFLEGESLAEMLTGVLQGCQESGNVTKQAHYDFGMRMLKSLIVASGMQGRGTDFANEKECVMNAVMAVLGYRMTDADRGALTALVKEKFGLDPALPWTGKKNIDLMGETLQVRHGALLVGVKESDYDKATSGLGAVAKSGGAELVLIPASGTMLGTSVKDFVDSLTAAMRKQADKAAWIVIPVGDATEAPVADYLECLNTLLDDNKKLCLETGERIALKEGPNGSRIIFLAAGCGTWSPASVSRVGICQSSDGGW